MLCYCLSVFFIMYSLFFSFFFFFKQKTAYEMRMSDWSSDVCSSDLLHRLAAEDDALTIERAAEVPPDDRNPAMPSRHHHFRDFHRLRKLEAIMSVDREPARRAAIHQLLEIARLVLQRLQ